MKIGGELETATPASILEPHVAATRSRCTQVGTVFVAHDSTEFRFSSQREGLGRVAGDETHGFLGRFALAVSAATRAPLGILGLEAVFRERGSRKPGKRERRPLDEKESRRWLDPVRRVAADIGDDTTAVHVMDLEADAYELLAAMRDEKHRRARPLARRRILSPADGRRALLPARTSGSPRRRARFRPSVGNP